MYLQADLLSQSLGNHWSLCLKYHSNPGSLSVSVMYISNYVTLSFIQKCAEFTSFESTTVCLYIKIYVHIFTVISPRLGLCCISCWSCIMRKSHLAVDERHSLGSTNIWFRVSILQSLSKLNVLLGICSSVDSCKYVCRDVPSKKMRQNPKRLSESVPFTASTPRIQCHKEVLGWQLPVECAFPEPDKTMGTCWPVSCLREHSALE